MPRAAQTDEEFFDDPLPLVINSIIPVNTLNEYALLFGQNMPNHSATMAGRGKFVRVGTADPCIWRTKQSAFRFAAWLTTMAEMLPDEDGAHTLEEITEAIQNT